MSKVIEPVVESPSGEHESKVKTTESIVQIVLEMARVAKGKTVTDLRDLVRKLYPATREEALEFQKILDRLKLASEAVNGYGTEQFASLTT